MFMSTQAIAALQISSATFYRHTRKLGLQPRKKYRSNARWWLYDDVLRVMDSVYPTPEERAVLFFRMTGEKMEGKARKFKDPFSHPALLQVGYDTRESRSELVSLLG